MAGNRIRLQIEGADPDKPNVRLADFISQLEALRHALAKTELASTGRHVIDWEIVGLSHSSPATVELEPVIAPENWPNNTEQAERVVTSFFGYVDALSKPGEPPPELDRSALIAFKELASPVRHERIRAHLSNGKHSVELVGKVEHVIEAILAPKTREEGSVDGRLEFINIHGGKNVFRVWPIIGPHHVNCRFRKKDLALAGEAVGHEVRVSGQITYLSRDPFPHSIDVKSMEILPDEKDLPLLRDLRGTAPNATGKLSSEDFVRALRSEA